MDTGFVDHPEEATAAVPFDPFADEDSDSSEIAAPLAPQVDSSELSRQRALSTFRQRRGTSRGGAVVAGGMVTLPFVHPTEPAEAIIDPAEEIAKGVEPPTLRKGDIIANQYEILGPVAHGGLGWIYIAIDHFVADRYVVLKGLMETENEHERAVAESERSFLADITHPGIVKIFNFIDDPRAPGGFIVMEFVGGPSLRNRRRLAPGQVLDVDRAMGYILEVLPALDYLHSRGVVYNDLKPDNIIITEDQVKLIDLGAVTGVGAYGHIFGTRGFQAPEITKTGPTVASDIYTVGRTLASLIVRLPVTDGVYDATLPTPDEEPLFREYMSLYRLLLRATDPDPEARFSSATAMANQMVGVLREILAVRDGRNFPHLNTRFTAQRSTFGTKHIVFRTDQLIDGIKRSVEISAPEVVAALPTPLTDPEDPGAALLSAASFTEPGEVVDTLRRALGQQDLAQSVEIPLTMVRARLDMGQIAQATQQLEELGEQLGDDWRYHWHSGIASLLTGDYAKAQQRFNRVLYILPGEPAPKLALAATDELMLQQQGVNNTRLLNQRAARAAGSLAYAQRVPVDDYSTLPGWGHITNDPVALRFHAMRLYGLVWITNPNTVSSAFGLARQLQAEAMVDTAVSALDRVPQSSRHQRLARLTTILLLISDSANLTESRIRRAARRLEMLPTNEPRMPQVRLAVLSAGLQWLRSGASHSTNPLFDVEFTERGLRTGLEAGLRQLARQAQFARHRYRLVDMANRIRPRTWF
ncbi:serine/threonine protein kinase [Corynebacterium heidelbergense]|uniref:non-specific serine/threonine protein kinase n=1 Tax=Corynebacterium heidelbergense TaxID=2055947 RepID=A0A364VC28_9CORY|nr:serine/threonine protein kinase [Corynebacterium heidelbergense]RAV34197.1 serine/threonine protein kinase [Corynebacterium heidelbergense]